MVAALLAVAVPAAAQSPGHAEMLRLLDRIKSETAESHVYLGDKNARAMRARIENMRPDAPDAIK